MKAKLQSLGADIVIKDIDLMNRDIVKDITSKASIRLALNCVGGKTTSNMLKLLASDAYIVTYGAMAREPLILPATPLIFKNLTAKGFWVSKWHQTFPEERKKELAWLCEHIQNGQLKDVDYEEVQWGGKGVDEETAWNRVKEALNKIREGRGGKKMVLVNYDADDLK
jgi:mitochondrial enoyl-[acyl-carrier protein] reductase / trans-2-enoyl-CoA reductase